MFLPTATLHLVSMFTIILFLTALLSLHRMAVDVTTVPTHTVELQFHCMLYSGFHSANLKEICYSSDCFHSEYGDTLRREAAEFCKSWETITLPQYQQGTLLVQDNGWSPFHFCSEKIALPLRLCSKIGISNNPSEAEFRVKYKKRMAQEDGLCSLTLNKALLQEYAVWPQSSQQI